MEGTNEGLKEGRLKAYQMSVRKEAAYHANERKALLREKVEEWKEDISVRENGIDPLRIFPEEIWTMILENVTDRNDLSTVTKANPLFDRIVKPIKKVQGLFEQVFPFVAEFLDKDEVLNCRLVCKPWCSSIDHCLESGNNIDDSWERNTFINNFGSANSKTRKLVGVFEVFATRFSFHLPHYNNWDYGGNGNDIEVELRAHPRNPFIGRSITIMASGELEPRGFLPELERFLGHHGQHIWHLRLMATGSYFKFRTCQSYYYACVQILTRCPNLRTLFFDDCIGIQQQQQYRTRSNSKKILLEFDLLPHHASLESLEMDVNCSQVLLIQDKLLEKYSSQLKGLSVHLWNGALYQNLPWANLRELEIMCGFSTELMESLMKMNAPNLWQLGLCLTGKDESSKELGQLLSLLSNLGNVGRLHLTFLKEFNPFKNEEFINLQAKPVFSPHIKLIEIDCPQCPPVPVGNQSFDFLISFPCLENVIISVPEKETSDDSDDAKESSKEDAQVEEVYHSETDYLRITKYLLEVTDPKVSQRERTMYKSNVWDALTSLQRLDVHYPEYTEKDKRPVARRQVYCRHGYVREKSDRKTILNGQLNCAHREADRQNGMRSRLLRQQLRHQRLQRVSPTGSVDEGGAQINSTETLRRFTDKKDLPHGSKNDQLLPEILEKVNTQWLFEKIFPMILMKLDKSDILSCRQVCSKWCTGVDSVMVSYHSSTPWARSLDPETFIGSYTPAAYCGFNYIFHSPFPINPSHKDAIRESMSTHQENPFIGRSVSLELLHYEQDPEHVKNFVELLGEHIWHFTFALGGMDDSMGDHGLVNPIVYYDILGNILANCPNLRTLHLSKANTYWSWYLPPDGQTYNFPLPVFPPHFENLRVEDIDSSFWPILHALLKRYSSQLKCFNTYILDPSEIPSLRWDSLEELHVNEVDYFRYFLLDRLTKMRAPKLTRLYIKLTYADKRRHSQLKTLIAVTHHIPTLTELHLKLGKRFNGFTAEEVVNMTPGFTAPASLTSLELIMTMSQQVNSFSFDFLIFFPHLKRLRIRNSIELEEIKQEEVNHDDNESNPQPKNNVAESEVGMETDEVAVTTVTLPPQEIKRVDSDTDFVQLPMQFWKNIPKDEEIYKLNVWQVLRSLQRLEFSKTVVGGNIPDQVKIYTRQT